MLDVAGDRVLEIRAVFGRPWSIASMLTLNDDLQRGVLVEIVDDDLRIAVALQLDDDARVLVRLVAHRADVGDAPSRSRAPRCAPPASARFTLYGISVMTICSRPPFSSSTPALPRTLHCCRGRSRNTGECPPRPQDHAARREIRPFHVLHQPVERDVRIVDLRADAVDHFAEIVRRDVRRHADRDAGAAVDEQVRERGGEDGRLGRASRRSSGRNRPCPCPCRP